MRTLSPNLVLSEISQHPSMRRRFHNLDKPERREVLNDVINEGDITFKILKRCIGRLKRRLRNQ